MNKKMIAVAVTAFALLPLAVKATQNNLLNQEPQISSINPQQIAQNSAPANRKGRKDRMNQILQQLDLSAEQSQQIAAIREQSRLENATLAQDIRVIREQMRSLLSNDASSEELRQQHQAMQDLRQQMGDNRFEAVLQVREILTPEQRDRMMEWLASNGKNSRFYR